MINPKYAYLISELILFIPWLYFWKKYKKLHTQMLIVGGVCALVSILGSYFFWTIDWWQPLTVSGHKVGIEDLILGFLQGGVVTVFISYHYHKYTKYEKNDLSSVIKAIFVIIFFMFILTALLFWGVGTSSFWATTSVMIIFITLIDISKNKYFNYSIYCAFLCVFMTIFWYALFRIISPVAISHTYSNSLLSGIRLFNIPIEEFVFFFLFGAMIGPFWDWIISVQIAKPKSLAKPKFKKHDRSYK